MSHTNDSSCSPSLPRARLGLATLALVVLVGVSAATTSCVSDPSDPSDLDDPCALTATKSNDRDAGITAESDDRDAGITAAMPKAKTKTKETRACPKPPEAIFTTASATAGTGSDNSVNGCGDPKTCTERP